MSRIFFDRRDPDGPLRVLRARCRARTTAPVGVPSTIMVMSIAILCVTDCCQRARPAALSGRALGEGDSPLDGHGPPC